MSDLMIKCWKGEKPPILVESCNWDCFLLNEALNPLVNWLNVYHDDIECGKACNGHDKINDVTYVSVYGNLSINTNRDFVLLTKEHREQFILWLNKHRDILGTREVIL